MTARRLAPSSSMMWLFASMYLLRSIRYSTALCATGNRASGSSPATRAVMRYVRQSLHRMAGVSPFC